MYESATGSAPPLESPLSKLHPAGGRISTRGMTTARRPGATGYGVTRAMGSPGARGSAAGRQDAQAGL